MRGEKYDGMIITGAPVEQMDFEEVTYWDEITESSTGRVRMSPLRSTSAGRRRQGSIIIMECRSMHWIRRCSVSLNIVPCNRCIPFSVDLMICSMCRIAATRKCAGKIYRKVPELTLLSESEDAGVYMAVARGGREFFVTGHSEYSPLTLDTEYRRDLNKGLPIEIPRNYYVDDDPDKGVLVRWRAHANLLFSNWLNYFVYQETPYNINEIG